MPPIHIKGVLLFPSNPPLTISTDSSSPLTPFTEITNGFRDAKSRGHFSIINSMTLPHSSLVIYPSFSISRTTVCFRVIFLTIFFSLSFIFLVLVLICRSSPGARPHVSLMYTLFLECSHPLPGLCYYWNAEGRGNGVII